MKRYSNLTESEKGTYRRVLNFFSDLRSEKGSYSALLRKLHLDGRTVRKYLGRNLLGGKRGRPVRASKTDNLIRELFVPTPVGDVREPVRGLPAATKLSDYYHDREKLLGDKLSPEEFEAKWRGVRVNRRELYSDTAGIFRMEDAGILNLKDLYSDGGPEK